MKTKILTIGIATMLTVFSATTAFGATFTDVPSNHWAYNAVENMAAKGVVNGTGDGKFSPEDKVAGTEFTAMMTRSFYGEDVLDEAKTNGGKDWSTPYIETATDLKLLDNVTANTAAMNRTNMAGMIYNFLIQKEVTLPTDEELSKITIPDIGNLTAEQQKRITVVYALGYLKGVDSEGNFKGSDNMTRAEAATVLTRLMEKYPSEIKVTANDVETARKEKMGVNTTTPTTPTTPPPTSNTGETLKGEYWKNDEFEVYVRDWWDQDAQKTIREAKEIVEYRSVSTSSYEEVKDFSKCDFITINEWRYYDDGSSGMLSLDYDDLNNSYFPDFVEEQKDRLLNIYHFYSSDEKIVQVDKYGRYAISWSPTIDGPKSVTAYITVENKNGKTAKIKVTCKCYDNEKEWYTFDEDYQEAYNKEMFRLVNEARKEAGVPELSYANGKQTLTNDRVIELSENYSHNTNLFTTSDVGTYGENIQSGNTTCLDMKITISPKDLASGAFKSWFTSEGHRNNILRKEFTNFCSATYCTSSGKTGGCRIYYIQLFFVK